MMKFVNWFLPPALRGAPPDDQRRARLIVVFCFAMAINSAPSVVLLFAGGATAVATPVLVSVMLYIAIPFLLRRTGSIRLSSHALLIIGCANLVVSSAFSGGLTSPGLVWWGAYIIFAVMLLGTKVGLFWTGVITVECIVYLVLAKNGIAITDETSRLDRNEALMSSYATAFIALYLLARVYENLKNSMMSELGEAQRRAEKAHGSARLVLDNVAQGLMIADRSGHVEQEHSEALVRWFGPIAEDDTLFSYLARSNARFAQWLELGWEPLFEDYLPLELVIDQLPAELKHKEQEFSLSYRPILEGGTIVSVLVVVTDVTELVAAARAEEEQRELLAVLQRVLSDRGIFKESCEESQRRVELLCQSDLTRTQALRELHTLKGNTGLLGLIRTSRFCHELENKLVQDNRMLSDAERCALREHWQQVISRILPLLGEPEAAIQLSMGEYQEALHAVADSEPYEMLQSRLRGWAHEPTHKRFTIFAEQIKSLAKRLDKGDIAIRINDGGVRLPRETLSSFWANFVHVVRNAVDHGLETQQERIRASKCESGTIELSARVEPGSIIIEISDDGRGIDWTRVAECARAKGLPAKTREELQAALFTDGISTCTEATETSGRGIGLSALRGAVLALGGQIAVESVKDHGTKFSFRFNLARLRPSYCPGGIAG